MWLALGIKIGMLSVHAFVYGVSGIYAIIART
jgi:hypothetical protein